MEYFKIEIDGKQFQKSYLIYIVELKHRIKGTFFYIGQTGDRNYLTARPAFRRLAGHMSDKGYATDNQVYRQIAVKILNIETASKKCAFPKETKDKVSNFLNESHIKMHVFPIKDFSRELNQNKHNQNRNYVENLEANIIQEMIEKYGEERILNKKILKIKEPLIKEDFELKCKIIEKTCC